MKWHIGIIGVLFLLFVMGCVSSPPPAPTTPVVQEPEFQEDVLPFVPDPIVAAPGPMVVFCDAGNNEDNAECFEEAFVTCERSIGVFWETSDGSPLQFESQGVDVITGECLVRVNVVDDSSAFFGQSANCSIAQSPAGGEHEVPYFDSYLIGPSTCEGTYVDTIVQNSTPSSNSPSPPVQTTPQPSVKEFSIVVNEKGVVGTKTFDVKKGDKVKLTITVDVTDVSFNGEDVYGPAQKGLPQDQYVFYAGHILPGKSKTVEFVANESFDFGVYWPGSSVLKGKGNFVVTE